MSADDPEVLTGSVGPPSETTKLPDLPAELADAARRQASFFSVKVRRPRCGECYRLIATPGDHADGCSHIPPPVSR